MFTCIAGLGPDGPATESAKLPHQDWALSAAARRSRCHLPPPVPLLLFRVPARLPSGNLGRGASDADHPEVAALSWRAPRRPARRAFSERRQRRRPSHRLRRRGSGSSEFPGICQAPSMSRRRTAAQRRVHRGALPPKRGDRRYRDGPRPSGEADLNSHFAAPLLLPPGGGGIPSSSWQDSTSAALSCSGPIASSRSATSRGRPWRCRR